MLHIILLNRCALLVLHNILKELTISHSSKYGEGVCEEQNRAKRRVNVGLGIHQVFRNTVSLQILKFKLMLLHVY